MGFHSHCCSGLSALDHRRLPAKLPAPHNTALLLLHIAAHKARASKNPPGVNRRALIAAASESETKKP
jgi:hypothetical protein